MRIVSPSTAAAKAAAHVTYCPALGVALFNVRVVALALKMAKHKKNKEIDAFMIKIFYDSKSIVDAKATQYPRVGIFWRTPDAAFNFSQAETLFRPFGIGLYAAISLVENKRERISAAIPARNT